jgi:hypothetical protein
MSFIVGEYTTKLSYLLNTHYINLHKNIVKIVKNLENLLNVRDI